MMHLLSEWLREIIFIILLAVFIDLLLPSNRMQSYVKVVISLLIFMTILSPLIKLLKTDFSLDALIPQEQAAAGEMASLETIMEEAKSLDLRRQEQAVEMVEDQIALQIKQQIGIRFAEQAQKVDVKLEHLEDGQIQIIALEINLAEADGGGGAEGDQQQEQANGVEDIQEVSITWGEPLATQEEIRDTPALTTARTQPIVDYLEQEWQVPAANIRIWTGR